MRRKELLINHGLSKVLLSAFVMLMPFGAWAQTLTVGGVDATDADALQNAYGTTVSYNSSTHTLTLNGATITCPQGSNDGAIVVNTMYPLYVRLQGVTTIDAGGLFAFCSTIGNRDATFTTDEKSPGQLLMKNAGDKGFFSHVWAHYQDGLGHSAVTTDNKQLIALGPVMSPAKGLYWVDQKFSITGQSNILYWDYMDKAAGKKSYSAPFTLTAEPERRHFIANSHELTVDETTFTVYGDSVNYIIHNKPTFDPEPGIYYEQLAVQLGNVLSPASGSNYPQYWYYLNDDENNPEPYSNENGASQFINLVESCKVCVYILDADSDSTFSSKDDPVVAEYTIRHRIKAGPNGDVQFADGQTWASFYNTTTTDLYLPDDLAAYIVTAVDDKKATLKAINCVPKNKSVLLKYGETSTTTSESAEGNLLQGTSSAKAVSGISGTVYALHDNKLMKVTSGDIPAGRGYLVVNSDNAAPQLSMIVDGEGTTEIENGKLKIENSDFQESDVWYDLQGRQLLQKPANKGLYIKNGKKIVINHE